MEAGAAPSDPVHQLPEVKSFWEAVERHRPDADKDRLARALEIAALAHEGQTRRSGEAYVTHPIEVAQIIAELRMDDDSIIAALFHDVLEDTEHTKDELEAAFGRDVVRIVEGVTKLKLNLPSEASDRQKRVAESTRAAESLRKMLLAMAQDIRVMIIKLADRLHNMRTLGHLSNDRQVRIANETLDVYAPLAARLGIWQVKWQLEDLAFKILHPKEFKEISELVSKTRNQRESEVNKAIEQLRAALDMRGLTEAKLMGRSKHLFSIYNKVVKQRIPFEEVYDLAALRVIVPEEADCYLALGIVHGLWLPMQNLFHDYIAAPKPNGYQSLHTKVIGPSGGPLEVQIRTERMHQVAEFGVAAHWAYKEGAEKADSSDQFGRLRKQLFDWSSDSRTSSDFLRTLSTDLFSEQVFCFTPKGDVLDLPKDSTPVDFAFRVHTDLGLTLVGAKVNGIMVPLSTKLQNGDVVELITRSNGSPSLDWLEYVKSQHARAKIRGFLRKQNQTQSARTGREVVERELKAQGMDPRIYLSDERMTEIAGKMRNVMKPQDVFARVGDGRTSVKTVVQRLKEMAAPPPDAKDFRPTTSQREQTLIEGPIDNVMTRRGKCCEPLPGDDVVGYVTRGRGIMIHRRVCPNLLSFMEREADRVIPIKWPSDGHTKYSVGLKIISVDRDGLLMDISTILAEAHASVNAGKIRTLPNHTAEIDITISVTDATHLRHVMNKIGHYSDVLSILRAVSSRRRT